MIVATGVSPAWATVYTSTNVPVGICDLCTVTSTLSIGDSFLITDVNVIIGSLTHTWDGDLEISITSPFGTVVTLSDNRGGSGDNFIGTTFDDEAATAISAGGSPFTGSFRPEGFLSSLDGENALGIWTLTVADQAGGDVGSINAITPL